MKDSHSSPDCWVRPSRAQLRTGWATPQRSVVERPRRVCREWQATGHLGEVAYAVVRAVQPQAVVKTGVATGVVTAFVLAAVADNEQGHLHSIDPPPLAWVAQGRVGAAVPPWLRARWSLSLGKLPTPVTSSAERDPSLRAASVHPRLVSLVCDRPLGGRDVRGCVQERGCPDL